ncbi:MAG: FIST C-terminal domain-containing protein [Synergistaceae bacterium]|nr:FIST C-terminal domain-containing protein [Synergistaceae bacterium]
MLKAATAVTYELDSIEKGISELSDKILKELDMKRSGIAIMLCDSDAEHEKLASGLHRRLGVPVVGFSSTAMFCRSEGLCDSVGILTAVSSDDVDFSVAVSEPLTPGNVTEQIELTYKRALDSLPGEPKLVMAFPPYILGIMLDVYPRELGRVSGGLPVFGGLPAHDETHGRTIIYCGDTAYGDRMAVVLVSGAVKPVMTVKNSLGALANLKRTVTSSKNNVVYKVGDDTFVRFLEQFGLDVEKLANPEERTTSFTTYPLLVEGTGTEETDGIPVVRTIHGVDLETGSGTAIGEIPEGATLSVGVLHPDDIKNSTLSSAEDIVKQMKENERDGYRYSMVFGVSCVARYYVMASRNTLEADVLKSGLPEDLALFGYYSFGEICPTSAPASGPARNAAHNESLVLLAL